MNLLMLTFCRLGVTLKSDTHTPQFSYIHKDREKPDAISNAIGYAMHRSRSHDAVIRVYDEAGNVTETHEHAGDFKEWYDSFFSSQATILGFLDDPVEAARRFWIL
jgi:hypothetical protein